jgi:hypothetical protein
MEMPTGAADNPLYAEEDEEAAEAWRGCNHTFAFS